MSNNINGLQHSVVDSPEVADGKGLSGPEKQDNHLYCTAHIEKWQRRLFRHQAPKWYLPLTPKEQAEKEARAVFVAGHHDDVNHK